jgi:hypothetical protein
MKLFNARVHRILDFVTVVILVLTPIVAGLGGLIALVLFLLAAVHLILTLATRFPGGGGVVSFWIHGVIELVVSIALVGAPFFFGFGPGSPARRAYVFLGALIFLVWLLTDYREASTGGSTARS